MVGKAEREVGTTESRPLKKTSDPQGAKELCLLETVLQGATSEQAASPVALDVQRGARF